MAGKVCCILHFNLDYADIAQAVRQLSGRDGIDDGNRSGAALHLTGHDGQSPFLADQAHLHNILIVCRVFGQLFEYAFDWPGCNIWPGRHSGLALQCPPALPGIRAFAGICPAL